MINMKRFTKTASRQKGCFDIFVIFHKITGKPKSRKTEK
jgi:hypothetical protein